MDPILGSALIAGGTSLFNAIFGSANQSSAQSFNSEEAEKQRNWQSGENILNRDYVSQENKLSRDWQSAESQRAREWEEQMYNLYNSPSAMMRQYKEANLNPYLGASGQTGQGMGIAAPMSGAPSQSSPSMVSGSPAQSPGFYHPTLASDYAAVAGVSAQAANQNAQKVQQEWETYQYIYYHVGKNAAKEFLSSHPEMISSDNPDNSPYMKQYQVALVRQENENNIAEVQSWLLSRYGYQNAEKALSKADAEIDNLCASALQSRESARRVSSEILQNLASAGMMKKQGDYYVANTETANQIRKYLVSMFMSKSGILDHAYQMDTVYFENAELLSGWLTSKEGKQVRMDMERIYGKRHASAVWTAWREFFDIVGKIKGSDGVSTSRIQGAGMNRNDTNWDRDSESLIDIIPY